MENSLEVKESQRAIPSFLFIGIFCVVHLVSALLGPINILNGELLDTDSYTRLNRVLFVHEQGHWNHSIYPRSNAPFGESIHWTKPLDLLLLAGGKFLALLMPFSTGLHVWGVVISPLLHVVAFLGILYLLRENLDRLGMILLSIVFLIQPILVSYFMIGRPDHHSLLLAVFCWFLAGIYEWPPRNPNLKKLIFIGGMGALGLWVSVEFLVPISLFLAVSTLVWVWQGEETAVYISKVMTIMFLGATLFLFFERFADDLFLIEYDKISLPHCVLMGLIAMVWLGINLVGSHSRWSSSIGRRIVFIGILSVTTGIVQWSLFPGFFQGPLVGMDATIRQLVWDNVAETQPLQISEAIMSLGIGILVLPLLMIGMWQGQMMLGKHQGVLLIIGASMFIPLALYESRWTPYASIILLIPYVVYVRSALEWVGTRWPNRKGEAASLLFGLILLFWPVTAGNVMALEESQRESSTIGGNCPLFLLTEYLNGHISKDSQPKTILAFKDFGPELLYRTSHQVIATPMHRNVEGLRDMLAIMRARDPMTAESIVQHRNIDFILICLNAQEEAEVYRSSLREEIFYDFLLKENIPEWLKGVMLPNTLAESFKLFEVIK